MRTRINAAVCSCLALLLALAPAVGALAAESDDARIQALERQLQRAMDQLEQQRKLTEEAQRAIGELRHQMAEVRSAGAPTRKKGGAVAAQPVLSPPMEEQIHRDVQAEVAREIEPTKQTQERMQEQLAQQTPAWADYAQRFFKKFKVGTLFYSDFAYYPKTGFGPQFLTQLNPPGPGNDNYTSFDVTRTYVNLFFSPTEDWTFRLTPNIYRSVGSVNQKFGKTGAIGSNLNGNLSFRLKYAYLDYNTPLAHVPDDAPILPAFREAKVTFGQLPNPLIAWEEDLYGYRFTSLVPWNYTSLSSTQTGLAFHGPVKVDKLQYADYDFGVYTNASFHAQEGPDTKQGMGRLSVYPLGATSRFDGLGITAFYDYGFPNNTPDTDPGKYVSRFAGLVHYTAKTWGVAGEYDQGHNAFTTGNLFSGSGPADEFGFGPTQFASFDALADAIQNNGNTVQRGFAFLGHVQIPGTPLTAFGMYQRFMPNTKVSKNPLDFQRIVVGVSYTYDEHLRFALDSQTLDYYHDQFAFPLAEAQHFGTKGAMADIAKAVPGDIEAVFLNVEFSY